jgi:hypothetical protein
MRVWLVLLACVMPGTALTAANDYPSFGILTNEREKDFIEYQCGAPSADGVACHFTQTKVSKKGGPNDLAQSVASIPEMQTGFTSGKEVETCTNNKNLIQAMRTGVAPPGTDQKHLDAMRAKPEPERTDMLREFESFQKICEAPTKENIEAWMRLQNDQEGRTCSVWVHSWDHTFTRQSPEAWVHSGSPEGLCGTTDISTFERDGSFWNYRTRRVVTDKNALKGNQLVPECRSLDEGEYFYTWNTETYYRGCDYIKFGF